MKCYYHPNKDDGSNNTSLIAIKQGNGTGNVRTWRGAIVILPIYLRQTFVQHLLVVAAAVVAVAVDDNRKRFRLVVKCDHGIIVGMIKIERINENIIYILVPVAIVVVEAD